MGSSPGPSAPPPDPAVWLDTWFESNVDCAVIFTTPDAVVVRANPAIERVLGYKPDELVGSTLRRIFTDEDLARGIDRHELEVALRLGRAEDDRWHLAKGGRRVFISGVLCQLRGPDGSVVGFAKVMRDRTDLHTEVVALKNLALGRADALALKDEALTTVGHELRNPIATLTQATTMLQRCEPGGADAARALAIVERQLALLQRLADDLRDAARGLRAAARLSIAPLVLQDAIRAAVAAHAAAAASRSQRLEVILPDRPIELEADALRLEQILRNLLDNAVKYTPPGGRIAVTATVEGEQAVLRVEDDGMGMSAEVLPKVFDLFTRDSRAVESPESGLGVGLALVRQLVALHHGVAQVQSSGPDQGSEFTVSLPLVQPRGAADRIP